MHACLIQVACLIEVATKTGFNIVVVHILIMIYLKKLKGAKSS